MGIIRAQWNLSHCGTACSTRPPFVLQEKRVSEYSKANVMASAQSNNSVISKKFSLEVDF